MQNRINFIKNKFGLLSNIKGSLQDAVPYMGLTPPTIKYMENLSQAGYANLKEDFDCRRNIISAGPIRST